MLPHLASALPPDHLISLTDSLDEYLDGLDAAGVLGFRLSLDAEFTAPWLLALADAVVLERMACGGPMR